MFSKACEYGIKAVIFIASRSGDNVRVGLKETAVAINSPEAFTAKILQQLSRNHIIRSTKGPNGGFEVSEVQLKKIKLIQIVYAIDGDSLFTACGLGLEECSEAFPCPVHHKFKAVRDELKHIAESTTLEDLVKGVHNGTAFLKV